MPITRSQSSPTFSAGELVVCVEKDCPYAAKIMQIKEHKKVLSYFVHYIGWSSRTDIKVAVGSEPGRLFKGTVAEYVEDNRDTISDAFLEDYDAKSKDTPAKATPAKATPGEATAAKDAPAKETPVREPPAKKRKVETPASVETPKTVESAPPATKRKVETREAPSTPQKMEDAPSLTVDFDWRFAFPTNLRELCIEDRARIHLGQLTRLPAAVTIDDIVDKYEDSLGLNDTNVVGTSNRAKQAELQIISVNGIRDYFNKVFHAQFLYAAEREQFDKASKTPDFSPSGYYGVVHLLRAFTTLSKMIEEAGVKQEFAEKLVSNSKIFIDFLSKNLDDLGVEYTGDAMETD
ncbi:hypothetical protein CAEBREN_05092 [Caenorhabditis brenneri]|uniref:Uncharacterized protein n=1 Tax=Caenorhabditis brenneri TaxID=135651 RepID=G0M6U2_CAEBE|nr:hypothetical protein CAEBREN_05092 [Caenorhabditis brenneri]